MSSIIEVGEVIHIAKSGRLILKVGIGIVMKSGENLFDNTGKKVGRVTELIGPVNAPYASV
ncbi:MAG: H/ACA ribonucleoprotein complex subunit GAR1, partial [Nitrososphaeraceae archaeon]